MSFHIFSARFECGFASSPLVSSVVLHLIHSFRVWFHIFSTRFECSSARGDRLASVSPEACDLVFSLLELDFLKRSNIKKVLDHEWLKIHSKRVEKMQTTLETSEEDANYTRNE